MKKFALAALATILMLGQADANMLGAGIRELNVEGYINHTDDLNFYLAFANGTYHSDFLQIGPRLSVLVEDGGDNVAAFGGAFVEYNYTIASPNLYPYLGGALAAFYSKRTHLNMDDDAFGVQASGYTGLKYFLIDNLALALQVNLHLASDDIYYSENDYDPFDWDVVLSTRFFY